jgi:hypothetical protein
MSPAKHFMRGAAALIHALCNYYDPSLRPILPNPKDHPIHLNSWDQILSELLLIPLNQTQGLDEMALQHRLMHRRPSACT